jgi:hypothetical protein
VPEAEVLEVEEVPFTRFRVRQPDSSSKPTMGSKPSSPGPATEEATARQRRSKPTHRELRLNVEAEAASGVDKLFR